MKKVILGLIVGLVLGYMSGYGDASRGEPAVWRRVLDKFGASRIKSDQEAHDRLVDSVANARRP